ncbi:MAG: hypothetical protein EPGJADBJ_02628 [Saprospiraceae bacterium]|nr:hypothetical protein [Saprospiraceae bacterium]
MKKIVFLLIVSFFTAQALKSETEPNDSPAQANILALNGAQSGTLSGADVNDWFLLSLPQGGILTLTLHKTGNGNGTLYLRDAETAGFPELSIIYIALGDSPPEGWTLTYPLLPGNYYIQINMSSEPVNYTVNSSLAVPTYTEDAEPNNTVSEALNMPPNGTVSGNVHYYGAGEGTDQQDWYKMVVPQGGILNLTIHKKGAGNTWIRFRDGELPGEPEITNYYTSYFDSPPEGWAWSYPVLAGTYYFQVEGGGGVVDYQMISSLTSPTWTEDAEPNDDVAQALNMPPNGTVSGTMHYYAAGEGTDQQDWFKMVVPQGGILNLTIHKKGPGNTWIRFRDGELPGEPEITNFYTSFFDSPPEGWAWSYPVLAGIYYFQVEGGGNILDYRLEAALTPPAWGEDTEPNDTLTTAQTFPINDSIGGTLGYYKPGFGADNWDWFVLNLPEYGLLTFDFAKKGYNNGNVRVRNASGEIGSQYFGFGDLTATWSQTVPAGVYYLGFEKLGGDFQYKVTSSLIPLPKADFTYTLTGTAVAFENNTQDGDSYFWNFDDGATATTVNAYHEYGEPGNFNVCMIAINAAGTDTVCQLIVLPGVARALPGQGGNTGDVTLQVFGGGLDTSYVARIMQGGTPVAVSNFTGFAGKSSISVRFDLRNKPVGTYDLLIEKAGGPSYMVPGGFRIVQGTAADPWVSISGRDRILFNTLTTYTVNYGNSGNVDARLVPVWFAFSNDPGLAVEFPNVNFHSPDTLSDEPASEGIFMETDSVFGQPFNARVYPLLLPVIPAGSTQSFQIRVKTSGNLKIKAWTEKPYYQSPINENKIECIGDALAEAPPELNLTGDKVTCTVLLAALILEAEEEYYEKAQGYGIKTEPKPEFISLFLRVIRASTKVCGVTDSTDRKKISEWATKVILNKFLRDIESPAFAGSPADAFSGEQCPLEFEPQNPQSKPLTAVSSLDPNEKTGLAGFGPENYVAATRNFPYTIHFENVASATAPAHTVNVTDQLDKTKFDLSTFSFGPVYLGDSLIFPEPGLREFVLDKQLNNLGVTARVHGQLDTVTGLLSWTFRSLDAVTLAEIEDPDLGFLPPNVSAPEGEGSVSFFVRLKHAPQHEEQVTNQAVITFDANAPIFTNEHRTTFDLVAPESAVAPLPATTNTSQFEVQWAGSDDGSGIQFYNIYVSINGGPDSLWIGGTASTSATFAGMPVNMYAFYSIAIDHAGNAEAKPVEADAKTTILTAVDEAENTAYDLLLFPNPAVEQFHILNRSAANGSLTLIQPDGRIAVRMRLQGFEQTPVNTAVLPEGLLQWIWSPDNESAVQTGRILIVRKAD